MNRNLGVAVLVTVALALAPAAAAAKTLYATPSPASGSTCSAEKPCNLLTALTTAGGGDTVVVGVGTYQPEGFYEDEGKSLAIAGAAIGVGRPVVKGGFALSGPTSHISDIEIDSDGFAEALYLINGASADRILAISATVDGCEIEASGATITNSLCVSNNASNSSAMASQGSGSGPMAAHNLTLIGHYGYFSNSTANPGLTLADSIAMTTHEGVGKDAAFNQGLTSAINSYFATKNFPENVTETNQLTEKPIFRGPGDYREASNSPSINAGSDTAGSGELDLNGNLRKIGTHTDVGAYEFVPSAPVVGAPSAAPISTTTATVNASINPNSGQTYYHVEYGPTAAHGSSTTTVILPAGTSPAAVHVDLSGLAAKSTVHYAVVAKSDGGTTTSADASFDTAALPATAKLSPTLRFKQAKGGKPKGQPLLDRSAIKLQVGCGPIACKVSVKGAVKIGAKGLGTLPGPKKATQLLAGKQGSVKLSSGAKLQRRVREYLEANPSARAKILVTATFAAGDGSKATRKLTIPVRPL
jgi:hypothetical protein